MLGRTVPARARNCNDCHKYRIFNRDRGLEPAVLVVKLRLSAMSPSSQGSSCGGGRLVGFGNREVHFLQEGLEAGVGAEGIERGPCADIGQHRIAFLGALF